MISLSLGHRTNFRGFYSTSINSITTKLNRPACTDFALLVMVAPPQIGHIANINGFILPTSPRTTKPDGKADQHALVLTGRCQ